MRQIQIGFENRQDLIISESIGPGRRWLRWGAACAGGFFSDISADGVRLSAVPECHQPRSRRYRPCSGCVVFHEPRMALSAPRRLAVEIALHKRSDLRFSLRQSYDVGPCIQLSLCVPTNHLVLPKRQSLGISLIHCGNTDIGSLLGIKDIDVAKIAWVERQLHFRAHAHSPP